MSGEFEPNDSRNVTGAASTPDGRWTAEGNEPPLANGQSPQPTGHQGREPHEGWSSQGQPSSQGGGSAGGGGLSQGDDDEEIGSEDVDGEEGVQFRPDQELIRKVGDDGGAGGLSNEGEGEDMENRNMGSESGAGANTFTGPSGGQAGNSQAGFGNAGEGFGGGSVNDTSSNPQNSGTEDAQAQLGQLSTNPAQAQMGQAIDGGWPDQMQAGQQQSGSLGEQIREHMSVIDAEGTQVGTVDSFENDQIKLTRSGSDDGQHHYLPLDRVAGIEGDQIRLHQSGDSVFGSNGS